MPNKGKFIVASVIAVVASLILTAILGLNYGIDFSGGTEIQVKFNKEVDAGDIRNSMKQLEGINSEVQNYGLNEKGEFLIKFPNISYVDEGREAGLQGKLESTYKDKGYRRFHHSTEGGDKVEFTLNENIPTDDVKKIFDESDTRASEVTVSGAEGRFVYRVVLEGMTPRITAALNKTFGEGTYEILRADTVGPKVGGELKMKSFLAVLYSLIGLLIYIAFRFDFRFAPGAIVCLAHDVSITVGLYALFKIPFTVSTIAALLTLIGYSLNDTIVVYDRIRENLAKAKVKPLPEVVNDSINETLSRTVITSGVTQLVVIALILFGGSAIFDFAFALFVGIIVGTYSSIFIAAPLTVYIDDQITKYKSRQAVTKAKA